MEKLLLVDSNALVYRAYHALPPLKYEGELVNAVYGFFLILTKVMEEVEPNYVVTAFDRKEKTFRHEEFEDYKAQRPDMPDELVSQVPLIKSGLKSFNIPVLDKKGFEADDIIGTLTKRWKEKVKIIILSGDRDLIQLVDDNVVVRSPGRGIKKMITFNKEKVLEKYSLCPELFTDYKALRGDTSDNIPGVKGIGKKRASRLINEYGSIEKIFDRFDDLPKMFQKRLKEKRKQILKTKKLVTLRCNINLEITLKESKLNYKPEEAVKFFKEFNFKTLINKYEKKRENQMKLNF